MNLNNRQRAGALIAALAVAALGVDRFVLGAGGPSAASAGTESSAYAVSDATGRVSPTVLVQQESLATRLDRFARSEALDPSEGVPDLFGLRWTVQTFGTGDRGGIRLDGKIIPVGGTLPSGETLVRVSPEGAYFRRGTREFFVPTEAPKHAQRRSSRE